MEQFTAPFGEVIELRQVLHDTGVRLLRVVIRDGDKYTVVELDPASAFQWGDTMRRWAEAYHQENQ